ANGRSRRRAGPSRTRSASPSSSRHHWGRGTRSAGRAARPANTRRAPPSPRSVSKRRRVPDLLPPWRSPTAGPDIATVGTGTTGRPGAKVPIRQGRRPVSMLDATPGERGRECAQRRHVIVGGQLWDLRLWATTCAGPTVEGREETASRL